MYWDEKIESMSRDELAALQLSRMQKAVMRNYEHVADYRKSMEEKGIMPEDIKSLDDVKNLPFTTKQDLRDSYPYGRVAVPMTEIVRSHASSGTTGKPTVVCYTKNDIDNWADLVARALTMAGGTKGDILQVAYGYGLFTGGLGLHYGGERLGASVIPASGGNTKRQLTLLTDLGSTMLACTPSYALFLAEALEEMGMSTKDLHLKAAILGAEPWSNAMRLEIEKALNLKAHDIYGLSEVMGPGVAMECQAQNGLHIAEDHFYVEIINPETGEVLPYGEKGEVVISCITKEGLPLIRYRTRDLSCLLVEPCPCGRTHARLERITGRSDDMLIIRGVNVFPSQIESALLEMGETSPHYHLIVERVANLDALEVLVEMTPQLFSDQVGHLEDVAKRIKRQIEQIIGISCKITLVEPKTLARSEGKAVRVTDKRKL